MIILLKRYVSPKYRFITKDNSSNTLLTSVGNIQTTENRIYKHFYRASQGTHKKESTVNASSRKR